MKVTKTTVMKTYIVACTNDAPGRCGMAYETNDAPSGSHKHKKCQRCGYPTKHTEKKPIVKTSRFSRLNF